MSPSDQRLWATLIHVSAFVVSFWGALIGYIVLRDRGEFVRAHAAAALNFQISVIIYSVGVIIVALLTFGIGAILAIPLAVLAVVFQIMAALAANRGEEYSYPLAIRFLS